MSGSGAGIVWVAGERPPKSLLARALHVMLQDTGGKAAKDSIPFEYSSPIEYVYEESSERTGK